MQKAALSCAAFLLLTACATPRLPEGRAAVANRAAQRGFVPVAALPVFGLLRRQGAAQTLTVYLEGDGASWPAPHRAPTDPTPTDPLVLDLAAADPAPAVAYLARPCQFLDPAALRDCSLEEWTRGRFAESIIRQMDQALTLLKQASGATGLRLVGYSGGGVIATVLASRRADVEHLVTIAAPLRVAVWTAHHGVTPLAGIDPDVLSAPLPPAVHFVGARDRVVPPAVVAPFAARTGGRLVVLPEYDHACCWSGDWQRLLKEMP